MDTQAYLFQRIREKIPADASLAEAVAARLFISADSAYRRIRGETPLVVEEAKILCEAYGISMDALFNAKKNTILFSRVYVQDASFEKYLESILKSMTDLHGAGSREITIITKDLPLFYDFAFRSLFAFQYFFWMKSIMRHPDFSDARFSPDYLPAETEKLGREILKLYTMIPSTEIWNSESINSMVSRIEYYREAGFFEKEQDASSLYNCLLLLADHLEMQAGNGSKFIPGQKPGLKKDNFRVFHNRLVLGSNIYLVSREQQLSVYMNYDVLDYLFTQDAGFCNMISDKLQNLMKRSTLISQESERQRNLFFNHMRRKFPVRADASKIIL